jgi:hypothetical protein
MAKLWSRKGNLEVGQLNITDKLSLQGVDLLAGEGGFPGAAVYYLNPGHPNASDDNAGTDPNYPMLTLPAAYALLSANNNQTLVYVGMDASINLSAAFEWAKDYTHFVGLCAPTMVAQRSRIFQAAGDLNLSPLFKISASGCVFSNLYIFQGTDDAQSLIDVQVTGSRNYFNNVHFAGGGHATNAVDGCASLNISGGMENTFVNCTVGLDTIGAAAGVTDLLIDGTGSGRNIFRNCHFTMWASNNGARFVELAGNSSLDRYTIFDRCLFINTGTSLLASFVIPAGFDPANKRFFLKDCAGFGFAKWDADDKVAVFGNMNAVTGADLSGVMVEIHS